MSKPITHAESSARRYGGVAADYLPIHDFMDSSKSALPTPSLRALMAKLASASATPPTAFPTASPTAAQLVLRSPLSSPLRARKSNLCGTIATSAPRIKEKTVAKKKKLALDDIKKLVLADLAKQYEKDVAKVKKAKTGPELDSMTCCLNLSVKTNRALDTFFCEEDDL